MSDAPFLQLKGHQWIQLAKARTHVLRLDRKPFVLALVHKKPDHPHRFCSVEELRHSDWIGGRIEVIEQAGDWALLSVDALFRAPYGIGLIRLPADGWARSAPALNFPAALVVGKARVKIGVGSPPRPNEALIDVTPACDPESAGWRVTDSEGGHELALNDSVVVQGPLEFEVERRVGIRSSRRSVDCEIGDAKSRGHSGIGKEDLLAGALQAEDLSGSVRIRLQGVAAVRLRASALQRLATGAPKLRLSGACSEDGSTRRVHRVLVDGSPLAFRETAEWPGRWALGLRALGISFQRSESSQ